VRCAAFLISKAGRIEADFRDAPNEAPRTEHRTASIGALLFSVSFLESSINELFTDAKEGEDHSTAGLDGSVIKRLSRAWPLRLGLLEKYKMALVLADAEPFAIGRAPYDDARVLIQVRNTLVHYAPESIPGDPYIRGQEDLHRLAKALRPRISVCPFYAEGNSFWPDRALGHGCAEWALRSSLAFTDTFFAKLGKTPPYEDLKPELPHAWFE